MRRELVQSRIRIAELARTETLLAGENRILEAVAQGAPLREILADLCRLIEEHCSGAMCGILLADPSVHRVEHGAAPSLPEEYNDAIHGRPLNSDAGPCGMAAADKQQVIVADIASDPTWRSSEWSALAQFHGLQACWSTPIASCGGSVLGTFAIYWREPRRPTEQDQKVIEQTTHLAAVAIERRQTETALRESEERFREMADAIAEVMWFTELDPERLLYVSPSFERIWGVPVAERYQNPRRWMESIHPDDRERVQSLFSAWIAGQPVDYHDLEYRILRPGGGIRWIHERGVLTRDDQGNPCRVSGISTDITERKHAAEALRASEHLARGQLEALASSLAALSGESVPEKFLEHVLRIAGEQLDAVGVSVWEMNENIGCVELAANYQGGVLVLPTPTDGQPLPRLAGTSSEHPVWTEFFLTGKHCVYGAIHDGPPWSEVAIDPDGPWYAWRAGMVDNAVVPQMLKESAASGVVATLNVPMLVAKKVTGLFVLHFNTRRRYREDEIELARAMAHQGMLAIKLMRLSQAQRESAVIAERSRMARDLHDTLAQGFTGIIMQLEAAKGANANAGESAALAHIERAEALARTSLKETRRAVGAMRSRSLVDGTLTTALDDLLKRMTCGVDLQADLVVQGESRALPAAWEEGLLRIAQEALTNTQRYARAHRFRATLSFLGPAVTLQLADDGDGFDPQAEHDGFGLIGMQERATQLLGAFTLRSRPGEGTEIVVELRWAEATDGNDETDQD